MIRMQNQCVSAMSILPSVSIASVGHVLGDEVLRVSCAVNSVDSPQMYLNAFFNGTQFALKVNYAAGDGQPGFEEVLVIPGWLRIRDLITTFGAHGVWKYTIAWEMSPVKGKLPTANDDVLNLTIQDVQANHSPVLLSYVRQRPYGYTVPVRPSHLLTQTF
jgi:hypothetical protein